MDAPAHFVPLDPADSEAGYRLEASEELLVDLHTRLFCTRFPDATFDAEGSEDLRSHSSASVVPTVNARDSRDLERMRALVQYWFEDFNWRDQEERLNRYPHRFADLCGQRVHYLRADASDPRAPVLLLLHGWPGSFQALLPLIETLSETFTVIVPSLPGFGFSPASPNGGLDIESVSEVLTKLLVSHLGFDRFLIHADELGWNLAHRISRNHPDRVFGVHLSGGLREPIAPPEVSNALLYALEDSPVGLAAWMLEQREPGTLDTTLRDEILMQVMIYWISGSIASAIRAHSEYGTSRYLHAGERSSVPTAVTASVEILRSMRHRAKRDFNLIRWTEFVGAGHLGQDLREFAAEALSRIRQPGLKTARRVSSAPSAEPRTKPA